MAAQARRARIDDVHELVMSMPHVSVIYGSNGNSVYQVGGKSFIFFRNPRPDATDPATGQRYPDVIVFWVDSEADKQAMVQDDGLPFFTTAHFDGHPSVLLRGSRIGELTLQELTEVVQDAWLCRASAMRSAAWLRHTAVTTYSGGSPTRGRGRGSQSVLSRERGRPARGRHRGGSRGTATPGSGPRHLLSTGLGFGQNLWPGDRCGIASVPPGRCRQLGL